MSEKAILYQLRNIEIINLFIGPKPSAFKGDLFHFDIKAEAKVLPDKKIVFMLISIVTKHGENPEPLGIIETALAFEIENFSESILLEKNENTYIIPENLEILLRTISISTTRGIMYSHFKGTYLHKAILPIIPQLITPVE